MKPWTKYAAVTIFVAGAMMGGYMANQARNGVIYVYVDDARGPAAVPRAYDLSNLDGHAFSRKVHERLIGDAHVLKRQGAIGLELGQFVTEGPNKRKEFACSAYNHIVMTFIAEGVAESGDLPQMTVEGNCEVSESNINWIKPIWIPIDEAKVGGPANKEVNFYDQEPVSLRFAEMGQDWPSQWVLNSVRLYNDQRPGQEIVIDHEQIRQAAPKSIILEW